MDVKALGQKIGLFVGLYLIYQNIFYILLTPDLYSEPIYVIYLIMSYTVTLIDTFLRSDSKEQVTSKKYTFWIVFMLLAAPFFLIGAYYENLLVIGKFLPFWDNLMVSYIGFFIFLSGSLLIIVARAQIGRFGTADLVVEKDHELITTGVYEFIRNPMYTGTLIAVTGFSFIFRCLIVMVVMLIGYFLIFHFRILKEESILKDNFGKEFTDYMTRTYRLIPFVY